MKQKMLYGLLAASIALNILLSFLVLRPESPQQPPAPTLEHASEAFAQYPYLSKRIFIENQNDFLINFIPLRQALREYVGAQEGKVGVYFEYLPSGTSIGVNDRTEVKLASLSKVPLVMSIYKKMERGQLSLQDRLEIKEAHLDNRFGTLWQQGVGIKLTIDELLKRSLIESDNTAYEVLFDALTFEEINEVYDGLDIEITQAEDYQTVSPKSYSSIFRSLYLASFLSKENSNQILEILTLTPFSDKLVAGVPNGTKVAHKIGVFTSLDTAQDVFIDCGIIYVPNRPYTLCIFVRHSEAEAATHMSHISKMVYGYVTAVRGGS